MAPADVELRVAVTEVQAAVRSLDTVGAAMGQLGTAAQQASREARDAFDQLDRSVKDVGENIASSIETSMQSLSIDVKNGLFDVVRTIDNQTDRLEAAMREAGERAAEALADAIGSHPIPMPSPAQEQQSEEFGSGLAKKAVAAFGALFALDQIKDLFAAAIEQEQIGVNVAAGLGLGPDQAKAMGAQAGAIYAQAYGDSYEEVAGTLGSATSSFRGQSPDEISDITKKSLSIQQAFGIESEAAIQSAGTLMMSGLASDATQAFDLLVAGGQRVPTILRENLFEASDEYSQYFRTLGFSGEEAFNALVVGAEKGEYGIDKTGDAIKEFTLLSIDLGNKNVTSTYEKLGLDATAMSNAILTGGDSARTATRQIIDGILAIEDPTARATAALSLFGTPLEDMNVQDIPAFLEGLRGTADAMGGQEGIVGAAQQMSDALGNTAASRIETFTRTLRQNVVEFIGNEVLPRLEDLWNWLVVNLGPAFTTVGNWIKDDFVPWLKDAADWYQRNKEWIDPLVVALGTMFTAFLALYIIKEVTLMVIAFSAALAANPIVLVITLIAGLIAGLIYAYQTSETFRNIVDTTWQAIQLVVQYAWDNVIFPVLSALWTAIQWVGDKATWLSDNIIQPVFGWIGGVIQGAWVNFIEPVFNWFQERIDTVGAGLLVFWSSFVEPTWNNIATKVQEVWDNVINPIWTKIQEFIAGCAAFFEGIKQGIANALEWTKQAIEDIKAAISGFFDEIDKKSQEAAAGAAQQGVGGIGTVTGTTDSNILGSSVAGGSAWGGTAAGGLISGHGGPRQDLVGRMLSPGEFVVNATSTARHLPLVRAINSDTGMADGGMVMGQAGVDLMFRAITGHTGPLLKQGEEKANQWQQMGAGMAGAVAAAFSGLLPAGAAVERWRPMALAALAAVGAYKGLNLLPFIGNMLLQITSESGGRPDAINLWDSNAQKGIPSMGLLQTIMPTFVNALMGTPWAGLIGQGPMSPWPNMIASILYGLKAYGSLDRAYRGVAYDLGGPLHEGFTPVMNKTGGVEEVLTPQERATWIRQVRATNAGAATVTVQQGAVQIHVHGDVKDPTAIRGALEQALREILADQMARSY